MKKYLQKIYNVVVLRREIRKLKKQIKEMETQINTMIKNAKEREENLRFANERANKFLTQLRKAKKQIKELKGSKNENK